MQQSSMTSKKVVQLNAERYGFVCDCGGSSFLLTTPNEVTCCDCGFTHPDIIWFISYNGKKITEPVIKIELEE